MAGQALAGGERPAEGGGRGEWCVAATATVGGWQCSSGVAPVGCGHGIMA
jgi:hypothetical protein